MDGKFIRLFGEDVPLPLTEGDVHTAAFHGTSQAFADTIARGGFKPSTAGFMGEGVYFWLYDPEAAIYWATRMRHFGDQWAVLKCVVKGGCSLHVNQLWDDPELHEAVRDAEITDAVPAGWPFERLQYVILAYVLRGLEENHVRVDSVYWMQMLSALRRTVHGLCVKTLTNIQSVRKLEATDLHSKRWRRFR